MQPVPDPALSASMRDVDGCDMAPADAVVSVGRTVSKGGLSAALLTSPLWRSAFVFELPSQLQSKSNFRRGSNWRPLTAFSDSVATTALMFRPAGWVLGSADRPVAERPPVLAVVAARYVAGLVEPVKICAGRCRRCAVSHGRFGPWRNVCFVPFRNVAARFAAFALLRDGTPVTGVAAALAGLVGPVVDFADLTAST